MMATGHKFLLVRLVSSDCIELGVRFLAPSSELNFELPFVSSAFVHQLVADLPSHEVMCQRSIIMPSSQNFE